MSWLIVDIIDILRFCFENVVANIDDLYSNIMLTPSSFNDGIWNVVVDFSNDCVVPVAWGVITLFALIELQTLMMKEQKGVTTIYEVSNLLLKVGVVKMFVDSSVQVVDALLYLITTLFGNNMFHLNINPVFSSSVFLQGFEGEGMLMLIAYMFLSIIILIVCKVCFAIVSVMLLLRFVKIYAWTTLSALAFATFTNKDMSEAGINYIKQIIVFGIQMIFLLIAMYMYLMLLSTSDGMSGTTTNPMAGFFNILLYSILLVLMVIKAEGWSKELLSVH